MPGLLSSSGDSLDFPDLRNNHHLCSGPALPQQGSCCTHGLCSLCAGHRRCFPCVHDHQCGLLGLVAQKVFLFVEYPADRIVGKPILICQLPYRPSFSVFSSNLGVPLGIVLPCTSFLAPLFFSGCLRNIDCQAVNSKPCIPQSCCILFSNIPSTSDRSVPFLAARFFLDLRNYGLYSRLVA